MALSLVSEISANNSVDKKTVAILPVGPVFQYKKFLKILKYFPVPLYNLHCFFMDEYMIDNETIIHKEEPLSFRGFIQREFADLLEKKGILPKGNINFPDPKHPEKFDELISNLGGATICYAGVGINGHIAFNEPINGDNISVRDFKNLSTRVVKLSKETMITNAHTALAGFYEKIPGYAVTIGMKSILNSEKIRVFMNRKWQQTVFRKILFEEPTTCIPFTLIKDHKDINFTVTKLVSSVPEFALE